MLSNRIVALRDISLGYIKAKKTKRVKEIPPLSPHPQMGKPVRKEKKLLHPEMDAGCFSSFSSGKEF